MAEAKERVRVQTKHGGIETSIPLAWYHGSLCYTPSYFHMAHVHSVVFALQGRCSETHTKWGINREQYWKGGVIQKSKNTIIIWGESREFMSWQFDLTCSVMAATWRIRAARAHTRGGRNTYYPVQARKQLCTLIFVLLHLCVRKCKEVPICFWTARKNGAWSWRVLGWAAQQQLP